MADSTLIEWARHPDTGKGATWNIVTGCDIVSPGCTNCYAMKLAGQRLKNLPSRQGLTRDTKAGPVWTGEVRFNEEWLTQPLKWKTGRGIFVAAHGDLFAEGVTDAQLDRIFAVMALCPQHVFMVLTKRPERMREYLTKTGDKPSASSHAAVNWHAKNMALQSGKTPERAWIPWPLPNVWLGVSVEDQPRADERIPILLDTPGAIRFISYEPALGPVDWSRWIAAGRQAYRPGGEPFIAQHWYMMKCEKCGWVGSSEKTICINYDDDADMACPACNEIICGEDRPQLDWIIAGGESGNKARPSHPDWFRQLRDQCASAGTAFFFKQWGSWIADHEMGFTPEGVRYPPDHPEQSRFETCVWDEETKMWDETNGAWDDDHSWIIADDYWQPEQAMTKVGKKAAGRRLEGVEHLAFPEVRP